MKYFLFLITLLAFNYKVSAQVEQATLLGTWQGDNIIGSQAFDNAYNEIWGIAVNNSALQTELLIQFFQL